MKIHNKAKLAFEMLERQLQVIGEEERCSIKGGEYVDNTGGLLNEYEKYLRNQMALLTFDTSPEGKKAYEFYKDSIYQLDILKNRTQSKFALSLNTSTGSTGGVTRYNPDNNTFESTVVLNGTLSQNMALIGHEIYHQLQHLSKDIDKDDMGGTYTKDDELQAYKKQQMILLGKGYFAKEKEYEAIAREFVNENYSDLSWASASSTGTAYDETQFDPNKSPQGSTGVLGNEMDMNGDWIQNFYYYDNTDPVYNFEWYEGEVFEFEGYNGFSTGFKNMTTGEITADTSDAYLYTSTGGYSTGDDSTGYSTGA